MARRAHVDDIVNPTRARLAALASAPPQSQSELPASPPSDKPGGVSGRRKGQGGAGPVARPQRRNRKSWSGRSLDDATLAEYLAARFEEGHSPAVAGQVVAAVQFYAKLGGQPSPVGPATERVLAGFRRRRTVPGSGTGGGRPVGAGGHRGRGGRK